MKVLGKASHEWRQARRCGASTCMASAGGPGERACFGLLCIDLNYIWGCCLLKNTAATTCVGQSTRPAAILKRRKINIRFMMPMLFRMHTTRANPHAVRKRMPGWPNSLSLLKTWNQLKCRHLTKAARAARILRRLEPARSNNARRRPDKNTPRSTFALPLKVYRQSSSHVDLQISQQSQQNFNSSCCHIPCPKCKGSTPHVQQECRASFHLGISVAAAFLFPPYLGSLQMSRSFAWWHHLLTTVGPELDNRSVLAGRHGTRNTRREAGNRAQAAPPQAPWSYHAAIPPPGPLPGRRPTRPSCHRTRPRTKAACQHGAAPGPRCRL